jgi:hypothetical protein
VQEWHGVRTKARTRLHQELREDERTRRARYAKKWNKEPMLKVGAMSWKRTSSKTFRETLGLETMKRAVAISSGLIKTRDWRGRPTPKRKNRLHTEYESEMQEHRPL